MDAIAEAFRALSDPTRLRILSLLSTHDLCVGDVMEVLDLPQSTVSRHLSYLRRTGWVTGRKSGRWMYYQSSEQAEPLLMQVQTVLRRELGKGSDARGHLRRLERHLQAKQVRASSQPGA